MAGEAAPLVRTHSLDTPPLAAAVAGSTPTVAPFAGVLAGATFVPTALVTGVATNNRTLSVVNRGQDGSGAVVMASITFGAGVNAPAYDEVAMTLSGTPANLAFAAGDVLEVRSAANGTGLADPGGLVTLSLSRS